MQENTVTYQQTFQTNLLSNLLKLVFYGLNRQKYNHAYYESIILPQANKNWWNKEIIM